MMDFFAISFDLLDDGDDIADWFSWTAKPTIGLAPSTSLLLEGRKQKEQNLFHRVCQ
jgi:hypothetical protein